MYKKEKSVCTDLQLLVLFSVYLQESVLIINKFDLCRMITIIIKPNSLKT